MSMRDFMQDLMRAQKASQVRIVHDASVASIPDDDYDPLLLGSSSHHTRMGTDIDDSLDNDYATHSRRSVCSLSSAGERDILLVGMDLDAPTTHSTRSCGYCVEAQSLAGFRERHRRLKETLSPVKVYRWSPTKGPIDETSASTTPVPETVVMTPRRHHRGMGGSAHHRSSRRDNLRSRLIRLASDSQIAPGLVGDAI